MAGIRTRMRACLQLYVARPYLSHWITIALKIEWARPDFQSKSSLLFELGTFALLHGNFASSTCKGDIIAARSQAHQKSEYSYNIKMFCLCTKTAKLLPLGKRYAVFGT